MKYRSTRGQPATASFTDVLMQGLAPDGGLYVPDHFPALPPLEKGLSYIDVAERVLTPFVAPDMTVQDLRTILDDVYSVRPDGFSTPAVTPLVPLDKDLSVLELFHGPTLAFKDVALQLLGRLFDWRLKRTGGRMTVFGATSGDTGSAAIEGCRHAQGVEVFILYPHERPSDVQRRQMTTVDAHNVHAIAVQGNFDDCQTIVKTLFNNRQFKERHHLSAVNSINWARIMAQVVYYVHAAYTLEGRANFIVPTGNFGNIYAGYVAKQMGAPINRLVVASNRNDILARFLKTGAMEKRTVEPSLSPSMDIQISSNFERLLFDLGERDPAALLAHMDGFTVQGQFAVNQSARAMVDSTFIGGRADDDQTLAAITRYHRDHGYTADPHTAVGLHVYDQVKDQLEGHTIALACAHPAKFPDAVERATGRRPGLPSGMADLYEREEHFTVLPADTDAVADFIRTRNGE